MMNLCFSFVDGIRRVNEFTKWKYNDKDCCLDSERPDLLYDGISTGYDASSTASFRFEEYAPTRKPACWVGENQGTCL